LASARGEITPNVKGYPKVQADNLRQLQTVPEFLADDFRRVPLELVARRRSDKMARS